MHFSEGLMVVLQLPRPGSDDLHALLARGRNKVDGFGDLWCWYVLMRHYIITMGRLEPKWLLPAFEGWELHNGPQVRIAVALTWGKSGVGGIFKIYKIDIRLRTAPDSPHFPVFLKSFCTSVRFCKFSVVLFLLKYS